MAMVPFFGKTATFGALSRPPIAPLLSLIVTYEVQIQKARE